MIGKAVRSKGGTRTFRGLGTYLLRPEEIRDRAKFHDLTTYIGPETRGAYALNGVTSPETAAVEMVAVMKQNRRVNQDKAAYHFLLAAPPGVDFSDEQMLDFARRALAALKNSKARKSLLEHQWLAVVHRDKLHTHVHGMVNLVDPDTFRTNYPSNDFEALAVVARAIDLEHGLEPTRQGALEKSPEPELPAHVRDIEKHGGLPSFYRRMHAEVVPALTAVIDDPDGMRHDFQRVLAERGVAYRPNGSGGVFVDVTDSDRYHAPGGAFGDVFKLRRLEQRFGTMFPPTVERRTYAQSGVDFEAYVLQRKSDVERAIDAGDGAVLAAMLGEWGLAVRQRGGGYVVVDAERPDDPHRHVKLTAVTSRARGIDRKLTIPIPRAVIAIDHPHEQHESSIEVPTYRRHDDAAGQASAGPASSQAEYVRRVLDREEEARANETSVDPFSILDRMGRERATFTEREFRTILRRRFGLNARQSEQAISAAAPAVVRVVDADPSDGTPRYTTRAMIAMERELVDVHARLAESVDGRLRHARVDRELATVLTDDQRAATETLLGRRRYVALLGPGGTGKSFAVGAVRRPWEDAGFEIIGTSLSARAANGLRDTAGIVAVPIAKLLHDLRRGTLRLHDRHIVVLDESGLAGTASRLEIARYVEAAQARFITLGDRTQLQPIEAGGASRYLEDLFPDNTVELREITRQRVPWQQDATMGLYEGIRDDAPDAVAAALDEYVDRGKVVTVENAIGPAVALAAQWRGVSESVLIATSTNKLARDYARAVQIDRIARHELDAAQAVTLRVEPTRFDSVFLESSADDDGVRRFHPGDRIIFKKADRRLGVINGTLGTVARVSAAGVFDVFVDDGRVVAFDLTEQPHVDLGYATNVFKAQGATADRVVAIGAITDTANTAYVLLGRHRYDAVYFAPQSATRTVARLAYGEEIRLKSGEQRRFGGIDRKDMALDYIDEKSGTLRRPRDVEERTRAARLQTAEDLAGAGRTARERKASRDDIMREIFEEAIQGDDMEAAIDATARDLELAERDGGEDGAAPWGSPDERYDAAAVLGANHLRRAAERTASLDRVVDATRPGREVRDRIARTERRLELAAEIAGSLGRADLFEGVSASRATRAAVVIERDGREAFRMTDRQIFGIQTERNREAALLLARVAWGGHEPVPQSTRERRQEQQRAEALGLRRPSPHLPLAAEAPRTLGNTGHIDDWRIYAAEEQRRSEALRWNDAERVADAQRRAAAADAYDAGQLWRAYVGQLLPFTAAYARREAAVIRRRNPNVTALGPWLRHRTLAQREHDIVIATLNEKAAIAAEIRAERASFARRHGSSSLPSAYRSWVELTLARRGHANDALFRNGTVAFTVHQDGRIDGFARHGGSVAILARVAALRFAGERYGSIDIDRSGALWPGSRARRFETIGVNAQAGMSPAIDRLVRDAYALGVRVGSAGDRIEQLEMERRNAHESNRLVAFEIEDVAFETLKASRERATEPTL